MLNNAFVGSENGLHIMGDILNTGGGASASSLSHGIKLALSASATARISSKTGCAPRSVKNKPMGAPRKIVSSGVNGIVSNIFFGKHGPQVPCLLSTLSAPFARAW